MAAYVRRSPPLAADAGLGHDAFIRPPADGRLGCFHLWAVMKNVPRTFPCEDFFFLSWSHLRFPHDVWGREPGLRCPSQRKTRST